MSPPFFGGRQQVFFPPSKILSQISQQPSSVYAMAHSYTNLLYHILFATKDRRSLIPKEIRDRVHEYLGGTIRGLGGVSLQVGGVDDHAHALALLAPTICVADFVGKLKSDSSGWMKNFCPSFAWQVGYAAFTVSESQVDKIRRYIRNQEFHHRKMSFKEELEKLLRAHKIRR
jgi:REP element-mobilizing transposase RayT